MEKKTNRNLRTIIFILLTLPLLFNIIIEHRGLIMLHNRILFQYLSIHNLIVQMEPQVNDTTIVLKVTDHLSEFPAHLSQINQAVQKARSKDSILASLPERQIIEKVIQSNTKMVEWQFIDMMQTVLRKIEPQIKHYPQHKSIKYLQSIIYDQLDPKIFNSGVRISKIRTKLLGDSLENYDLNIVDRFLTQLITVMSQLLQIMKQYYGIPRDDKVSGVLFQCIYMFVLQNQNCFLIQQDSKLKTQTPGPSEKIQEDKSSKSILIDKAQNALKIGQFLVGTLYEQIKNRVPFNDNKMNEKEIEQKKNMIKQIQNSQKREILDESSIKTIQKLISMNVKDIIGTMSRDEKAQFTSILFDTLDQSSIAEKKTKISKIEQIQKEIAEIMESTIDQNQAQVEGQFNQHKQIKWIVLIYKAMEKQYSNDPQRRKWLYRFCENKYILNKVKNPFFVIKVIEIDKLEESPIVKSLRNLPLTLSGENKKLQKSIIQAHLALQHQLNRIHLYQLRKKYPKQPTLQIQKLSSSKRRVITFLFSGFLSEDTDKVREWSGLLNNFYDSEVYSVRWESKSVQNMMQFAAKSIFELGPTQSIAMLGGPYVKAIAVMHNLYQKFQENPFNPAFEAAISTGQFFAEFLIHNFKGYFINLVGFSLGTELIKNVIRRLAQKNSLHILNKVYLMGGVADKTQVQRLIAESPSPLTVINLYSDNDYILKYLLRICKSGIEPVGLNPLRQIEGHVIKNEDCTHYVEGHLSYRPNMQIFAKLLKIADD